MLTYNELTDFRQTDIASESTSYNLIWKKRCCYPWSGNNSRWQLQGIGAPFTNHRNWLLHIRSRYHFLFSININLSLMMIENRNRQDRLLICKRVFLIFLLLLISEIIHAKLVDKNISFDQALPVTFVSFFFLPATNIAVHESIKWIKRK